MADEEVMVAPRVSEARGVTRPLLAVANLEVMYDQVILVLRGLSVQVPDGQIVAVLGANGAGKSTTLKAIAGLLPTEHGAITDGTVHFDGRDITQADPSERVRHGIAVVLEGRRVFEHLSVHENLVAGGYTRGTRADYDRVYELLPGLANLRARVAGNLSGGEQQQLAIGRALMSDPRLLILDEPSLGLAPYLVYEVFEILARLNAEMGLASLLVEQNAQQALAIAHYGYVMETGRVVLDGTAAELAANPDVKEFYLGLGEAGARRNYSDVKHYTRRKRWL
jgi:branched-chain amino acid transport system ATP-binding protein